jgi:hypothetical protein
MELGGRAFDRYSTSHWKNNTKKFEKKNAHHRRTLAKVNVLSMKNIRC